MKKIFSFALLATALASCSSEEGSVNQHQARQDKSRAIVLNDRFSKINIGTTQPLSDISFADENNGVISGFLGTMMKTEDGGASWRSIAGPADISYTSVFMFDSGNIFAGRRNFYKMDAYGQMREVISMEGANVNNLYFTTATDGYMAKSGYIKATTDGGLTWNNIHYQLYMNKFQFVSRDVAYAYGGGTYDGVSAAVMSKTTDGGRTWAVLATGLRDILAAQFINDTTGYIVDFNNVMFRTLDGGLTWRETGTVGDERIGKVTSLLYVDDAQIFATTTAGMLYKSVDGGVRWEEIHRENAALNKIYRAGRSIYVVGNDGIVLKN